MRAPRPAMPVPALLPVPMLLPRPACRLLLVCLCLLLLLGGSSTAFRLTLLHNNDVHARVEQTSRDSGKCTRPEQGCFGGVARRLSKVKELRASQQNVLLLDAGDQFQGTVWFNYFKGLEASHFMNRLRYDAMALGNHEFDNGLDGLLEPFRKNVTFPILSANIHPDATVASKLSGYILPYTILNVGPEKVGIVGYTSKETPVLSDPGPHLQFVDEIAALQPQVDKLRTLGVNKIIALGHSGFETDKRIAKQVKGVDVVIGGHTNTFLYTGTPPSTEVPAGPYPLMVKSDDGRNVPVVQAYAFGKYLGFLKVDFDGQGNVLAASGNPILLDKSIPEDVALRAEVAEWQKQIQKYTSQVIGKTIVYLNGSSVACRFRECNMGNMICDAMIYHNIRYPDEKSWNHVSMCLLNGGSIRAPIDDRSTNGTITLEDLISVLPFGNTYDLIQLKGSTLKAAFEHAVHRHGAATGEFLQVSGIHIVYDLKRTPGDRVIKISVLCTECRVPTYIPLEKDKVYKVILPSFVANGGDGYAMIKNENLKHDSGDLDLAVVSDYIGKMGKVYPADEGRIQFSSGTGGALRGSLTLTMLLLFVVLAQYS